MPRKQRSPSVGATRRLNGKLVPRHEPAFYRSLPYCVSRPFLLENVVVLTALACAAAYLRDDARAVMLVAAAAILHLLLPLEFSLLQGRFPRPFAQFLAQVDTLSSQDISWRKAIEAAPRTGERYCVLGGGGFLGSRVVRAALEGKRADAAQIGSRLAEHLLAAGAGEILSALGVDLERRG